MSNSLSLDVCFCACTKICKNTSVCVCVFPRGPPQVLIAMACYLLRLPSVTICQELSFALVYVDIKPHMLCVQVEVHLI